MWPYLFVRQVIVVCCFLLLSLAGCAPEPETAVSVTRATAEATLTPTATVTPTAPSSTPQPSTRPTVQPTSRPLTSTFTPTPLPAPTTPADPLVISPENAASLTQLARFGNGRINSITWSPDGTTFAVGSSQGIDFFDIQTLDLIKTIPLDDQSGNASPRIRFSPSGKYMMITMGGEVDRVTLWDAASGQYVRDLFDASLTDFLADDLIVYFDWVTQQLVWQDPSTGENIRTLSLPYAPRAFNLASGTAAELYLDTSVRLYDMTSGQLRHTLLELPGPGMVDAVAFSLAGDLLATGSRDGFIRLWDVQSGELRHELDGQAGWVNTLLFSPDGRMLAVSSGEKMLRLWDTTTGQLLHDLPYEPGCGSLGLIAFSPDGGELAAVSGSRILFFDTAGGALQRTLDNGYCFAFDAVFDTGSGALLIAGGDRMHTIDATGGQLRQTQETDAPVTSIAISPDGQWLAWGSGEQYWVQLSDVATGEVRLTIAEEAEPVNKVAFSTDGQLLVTQSGNWQAPLVQVREAGSSTLLFSHEANVFVFSPDGRFLATSITSYEPTTAGIDLWDTATFQLVRRLEGLNLLAFSPDGTLLAWRSATTGLWDMNSGELLRQLFNNAEPLVAALAFSPDGRLLLAIGPYGYLEIWDVDTGQGLTPWGSTMGSTGTFSPDGRLLATVSSDGIVRLWGVSPNVT